MVGKSDGREASALGRQSKSSRPLDHQTVVSSDHPSAELTWRLVKADGRPSNVVAFEEAVIEFFLESATLLGIPKSVAAIYGICFASPEPLSFSDINDRLNISSGSISQGLRVLKEVGALKVADATETPRSRNPDTPNFHGSLQHGIDNKRARERYEPDLELRKLVLHWIEKRLQAQLTSGRGRLLQIIDSIPETSSASAEKLKTRFESLQTWQDKAHSLLPIAKTFLKLT
jgi:DNA-binding transcriptional regulator GbsR (MarR family)